MSLKNKKDEIWYQVRKLYRKEIVILQSEGFVSFVKSIAAFSIKLLFSYSKYYLYEEMLNYEVPVPPHRLENLKIKTLYIPTMTQFDYETLGEEIYDFEGHPDVREYVPGFCDGPQVGIGMLYATLDGEFVHRNAVTFTAEGTYYGKFRKKIIPPFYSINDRGTCYRVLCVTNPKYRGKGVYDHLEFEMHNFMRSKGYSKLVYTCDPDMIFDLRIFDRMGSKARFKLYQIKLFSLFEYIWSRECKEQPLDELGIPQKRMSNHAKDIAKDNIEGKAI